MSLGGILAPDVMILGSITVYGIAPAGNEEGSVVSVEVRMVRVFCGILQAAWVGGLNWSSRGCCCRTLSTSIVIGTTMYSAVGTRGVKFLMHV